MCMNAELYSRPFLSSYRQQQRSYVKVDTLYSSWKRGSSLSCSEPFVDTESRYNSWIVADLCSGIASPFYSIESKMEQGI